MSIVTERGPLVILGNTTDEELLLKQLLYSPRLVGYFEEIKHTLEEEQRKRQEFIT